MVFLHWLFMLKLHQGYNQYFDVNLSFHISLTIMSKLPFIIQLFCLSMKIHVWRCFFVFTAILNGLFFSWTLSLLSFNPISLQHFTFCPKNWDPVLNQSFYNLLFFGLTKIAMLNFLAWSIMCSIFRLFIKFRSTSII